ncbi:MAG TPA: hypothetical protein VFZ60_04350 [Nitrososphaeraceae archaeon]
MESLEKLFPSVVWEINSLIIILEKDKITSEVRNKLLKKGLSLIGMSDKEIIFRKLIRSF